MGSRIISHATRLSTAHTTRLGNIPGITANSLQGIKERSRIPLALDRKQGLVGATEESLLPVQLAEVGLVLVAAAVGSDSLKLGNVLVGDLALIGDHLGPRGGLVPASTDLHGHRGVAESGGDSVADVAGGNGNIHADTDSDHAGLGQVTKSGSIPL